MKTIEYVTVTEEEMQDSKSIEHAGKIFMDPKWGEVLFCQILSDVSDSEQAALKSLAANTQPFVEAMSGDTAYRLQGDIQIFSDKQENKRVYVAVHWPGFPGLTYEQIQKLYKQTKIDRQEESQREMPPD